LQSQRPVMANELRQKLNPRMLQSIRILALPILDLSEEIRSELEENPALEVVEDSTEESLDSYAEDKTETAMEDWPDENADIAYTSREEDDSKRKFLEGAIFQPETLQEHLLGQFRLEPLAPVLRELGERLIQNLDDNGFHTTAPDGLMPGSKLSNLAHVMDIIRRLDPIGTCVADYRESLYVQASLDPEAPAPAARILLEHLDAIEKGRFTEVRKALNLKEPQFEAALAYIKTLTPFPGRLFAPNNTRYVVPDLAIRIENNEFVIELNDEVIPILGLNAFLSELAAKKKGSREAVSFARANVERARFFIGSIQQRNLTLVKVARMIAKFQARFFLEGPKAIQPLTLKDVADEVGVHETTISRIANGKYVQTDWGIFELRRFFTNAVPATSSSADQHSKEGVKAIMKEILESDTESGQTRKTALSDREIVDILAQRGVKIARRTVAKYRGELSMDSSFGRRKR